MSYQAAKEVLRQSRSRGPKRLLLLTIALHVLPETGTAIVSQRDLAEETKIDPANLKKYLKALAHDKELEIVPGKGRSRSIYRVLFAPVELPPLAQTEGGNSTPSENPSSTPSDGVESPPPLARGGNSTSSPSPGFTPSERVNLPPDSTNNTNVKDVNNSVVDLFSKLVSVGVREDTARALIEKFPAERIENQIAWLPARGPKDAPAALVSAIKGNWSPPRGGTSPSASSSAPPRPVALTSVSSTPRPAPSPGTSPRRETDAQADAREARERQRERESEEAQIAAERRAVAAATFRRWVALPVEEQKALLPKVTSYNPSVVAKVDLRGGIEALEMDSPLWTSYLEAVYLALQSLEPD